MMTAMNYHLFKQKLIIQGERNAFIYNISKLSAGQYESTVRCRTVTNKNLKYVNHGQALVYVYVRCHSRYAGNVQRLYCHIHYKVTLIQKKS